MLCLSGRQLWGGKEVYQSVLNKLGANVDMLSDAIQVTRRWENNRATGSKQNAKRSQRAGRLMANRARNKNNAGKSG